MRALRPACGVCERLLRATRGVLRRTELAIRLAYAAASTKAQPTGEETP